MKKILFATTALVATAGIAAADVAVTGSAEIGIVGGSDANTVFHTDIDVVFSMSGEADNGLTFGATIDIDETDAQGITDDGDDDDTNPDLTGNPAFANDADDGGAVFFVAYGGARLDMGDTDGAFDAVMQEVNLAAGSINDAETAHLGFNGNGGMDGSGDGQIARFSYTFDSFTGHLSVEQVDEGDEDTVWGLGVRYSGDLGGLTLGVGLGYQTMGDADLWGISLDTTFANGLSAGINYSDNDGLEHWAIGFGYSMNALSIGVNYGEYSNDNSGFGLAAAYNLGGGLTAQLGYGNSSDDTDSFSLGLAMSF